MILSSAEPFVLPVATDLPVMHELLHNMPAADFYVVQFVRSLQAPEYVVVARESLRFSVDRIDTGAAYRLLAFRIQNGIADGVWWVDNYVYDPLQVNIEFTSSGQDQGTGDPGSFSGSVLVAGQPAQRTVLATALDADVPYLLAQATSDAITGQYTLNWAGYSGQILITVMDDYGTPHVPGDARGSGERIHPTVPNGYVYDVSSPGELGSEPAWPASDGAQVTSGTVQMVAVPFYKPQSQGPFTV